MSEPLLAPRFVFRFELPLKRLDPLWTPQRTDLPEPYRLLPLSTLDGQRPFGDVRMAWSAQGIAWSVRVEGRDQPLWCRETRLEDSDGLQVWIDTRATLDIHRASRFCHRFAFLPAGGGPTYRDPLADQLLIARARENARPVRPRQLAVRSHVTPSGYRLDALLPAAALTGFDPSQHHQLGFTYALLDRQLGLQTFSVGAAFPYEQDPSTWARLELVS